VEISSRRQERIFFADISSSFYHKTTPTDKSRTQNLEIFWGSLHPLNRSRAAEPNTRGFNSLGQLVRRASYVAELASLMHLTPFCAANSFRRFECLSPFQFSFEQVGLCQLTFNLAFGL